MQRMIWFPLTIGALIFLLGATGRADSVLSEVEGKVEYVEQGDPSTVFLTNNSVFYLKSSLLVDISPGMCIQAQLDQSLVAIQTRRVPCR